MRRFTRSGFSLVEISIVLIVVSVMISGVLPYITESQKTTATNDTAARLEAIEIAILTFRAANGFIPCPSDINAPLNNANFGRATTTADCFDGIVPDPDFGDTADFGGAGFTVAGGVPTKTLGLADEYGFDGWGRRLAYHVDTRLTVAGTYSSATGGSIQVWDASNNPRTTNAAYAVVSHGSNGHGAFTRAGVRFNFGSNNADEHDNAEYNAVGTTTAYDPILHQYMATPDDGDPLTNDPDGFDDIVRFQLKPSLDLLVGGGSSTNVSFRVHKNGTNQTIAGGASNTLITWDAEDFDTHNNFDPATERFIPTVAGTYVLIVNLQPTTSGTCSVSSGTYVFLRKNGVVIAYDLAYGNGTVTSGGLHTSTIASANGAGDYFDVTVSNTCAGNYVIAGGAVNSQFSGTLVAD